MPPEERSVVERLAGNLRDWGDHAKTMRYLFSLDVPTSQSLLHEAVELIKKKVEAYAAENGCDTSAYREPKPPADASSPANVVVFAEPAVSAAVGTAGDEGHSSGTLKNLYRLAEKALAKYSPVRPESADASSDASSGPVAPPSSGNVQDVSRWLVDTLGYTVGDQVVCFVEYLKQKEPEEGLSRPKLSFDELMLADRYVDRIKQAFPSDVHHIYLMRYIYSHFEVDVDEVRQHLVDSGVSPEYTHVNGFPYDEHIEHDEQLEARVRLVKKSLQKGRLFTEQHIRVACIPLIEYVSSDFFRDVKELEKKTEIVRNIVNSIGKRDETRFAKTTEMLSATTVDWQTLDSWVPMLYIAYSKLRMTPFLKHPTIDNWEKMDQNEKNRLSRAEIDAIDKLMFGRGLSKDGAKTLLKGLKQVILLKRIWVDSHGVGMSTDLKNVVGARLPKNVRLLFTPNTAGSLTSNDEANKVLFLFCKGQYLEVSSNTFDHVTHKGMCVKVAEAPPLLTSKNGLFFDRLLGLYGADSKGRGDELEKHDKWNAGGDRGGRAFVIDCSKLLKFGKKIDMHERRPFPNPHLWDEKMFRTAFGEDEVREQKNSKMSDVLDRLARKFKLWTLDIGVSACNRGIVENPVNPTNAAKIHRMITDLRTVSQSEVQATNPSRRELALALLTDGGANNAEAIDTMVDHGLSPLEVQEGLAANEPGRRVMDFLMTLNVPVPSFMQLVMDVMFVVANYDMKNGLEHVGVWERNVVWCLYGPMNDINIAAMGPVFADIRAHNNLQDYYKYNFDGDCKAVAVLRANAIRRSNPDFSLGGAAMTAAVAAQAPPVVRSGTAPVGRRAGPVLETGPFPPRSLRDPSGARVGGPEFGARRAAAPIGLSAPPPTSVSLVYAPLAAADEEDAENLTYGEIVALATSRRLAAVSVYRWASDRMRAIEMEDEMLETLQSGDYVVYDPASETDARRERRGRGAGEEVYAGGGQAPLGRPGRGSARRLCLAAGLTLVALISAGLPR